MSSTQRPPTLDPIAVERWQRMAPSVSPWLHEEVAQRMLDRLQWIKLQPTVWVHWGAVRGGLLAHSALVKQYGRAQCYLIETAERRNALAREALVPPWWKKMLRNMSGGSSATRFEAPAAGTADMLWANMALHEAADPQALLAAWHACWQSMASSCFLA